MTAAPHEPWVTLRLVVPPEQVEPAVAALWDAGVAGIEERPGPGRRRGAAGRAPLRAASRGRRRRSATGGRSRWRSSTTRGGATRGGPTPEPGGRGGGSWWPPPGSPLPDWVGGADVVVRIDPGQAFGSGSHPTTRDCLAELESLVGAGSAVLDAGSGSGVLAVAAALLGAARVLALDVDPEAVRATPGQRRGRGRRRPRRGLRPARRRPRRALRRGGGEHRRGDPGGAGGRPRRGRSARRARSC